MLHKKDPDNWVQLQYLSNCFDDDKKRHLGVSFKDNWYCITHNPQNEKVLIPKEELDMGNYSKKKEYLKRVYLSEPKIINPTNMSISKKILNKYIATYGQGNN